VKSLTVSGIDLTDLPVDVGNEPLQSMQVTVAGLATYAAIQKGTVRQMAGSRMTRRYCCFRRSAFVAGAPRRKSVDFASRRPVRVGAFAFAEIVPGEYLAGSDQQPARKLANGFAS
jgi:hypothetical protein